MPGSDSPTEHGLEVIADSMGEIVIHCMNVPCRYEDETLRSHISLKELNDMQDKHNKEINNT